MKILITGGAGYLGGALTDILLQSDHQIRVYDSLIYEDDYLKSTPLVLGDVRDRRLLKKQLQWADVVVWLAAIVGDGACAVNPDIATQVNQESIKWLAENFDKRIIFMSTCSVYGAHQGILAEDSLVGPLSVYGMTKLAAEGFLAPKNAMIFRLGTLFGLGDRYSRVRLDLVVNTLTAAAMTDHRLKVFGADQFRPLLHVKDAAAAIVANLTTKHTGIYNLHRQNIKILNLVHKVVKQVPGTKIDFVDMKASDMRNYRVTSSKAQKTFGFKPKWRIEDGIGEIKRLFEEKRIKNRHDSRYTNANHLALLPYGRAMPSVIDGGLVIDERGQVAFVNDFHFSKVKRFYLVANHTPGFVRAWHGHRQEAKYALVVKGAAVVAAVAIDNWRKPSKKATVYRYTLSEKSPKVLCIPPGYANGFMALTADTQVMWYSTCTLEESMDDDWQYPPDYWDIWQNQK